MLILLADSDATLSGIYRSYFSRQGFDVVAVTDGLQCLAAIRRMVPDVLVLEYELLWGGGAGVLASLREDSRTPLIDVVLISCDFAQDELAHELISPVAGYLRKPFGLGHLLNLVLTVARNSDTRTTAGVPTNLQQMAGDIFSRDIVGREPAPA
ncbi:MAG: response regulator [Planctomycetaceae bacterium]